MTAKISLEKEKPKQGFSSEEFTLRPLDLKQDYEELIPFYELIFEKELTAKGTSVKAFLDEYKSLMPFFKFLGLFSKNFRHVFDGFVFENNQGAIISTVNIGYSGNYWEISMVATHPDYRRRGLARKLVTKSLEHAKSHGAKICVLEVLEENKPAYELYRRLGFHHFDTRIKLKLEQGKIADVAKQELPNGYFVKKRKQDKKTCLAMCELEAKATPEEVLTFLPVNKLKYHKPFLLRLIRPFVKLLVGLKSNRWTIHYEDAIVGILFVDIGRSEEDCHNIDLIIDPAHSEKITGPLISHALEYIKNNAAFDLNTITIIRKRDEYQLKLLERFGFIGFETDHILGLKFNKEVD